MSYEFDLEKEYKTLDGSKVVLYTIGAGGDYPIHAGIIEEGGNQLLMQMYSEDGLVPGSDGDHPKDIDIEREDLIVIEIDEGELVMATNKGDMVPSMGFYLEDNTILVNTDGGMKEKEFEFITPLHGKIDEEILDMVEFKRGGTGTTLESIGDDIPQDIERLIGKMIHHIQGAINKNQKGE